MAMSQAAAYVEKAIGHGDNTTTAQDVTNPDRDREKYGDPSGEKMKALAWMGKNNVQMGMGSCLRRILACKDLLTSASSSRMFQAKDPRRPRCHTQGDWEHNLRIRLASAARSGLPGFVKPWTQSNASTGSVVEMEKGDILGHEFCGKIDSMGPGVKNHQVGERVVASFQIACGDCMYCKKKQSSQCEKTNSNTLENAMYGGRTAGMFGYSHFTGGFAGGQAEYVRVPYGDVNLLHLPDDVPDEKGLYLSDVLSTSWNCVVDTGVKEGDVVAIWGAGPIGQMCAEMSFMNGAKRVILIDGGSASWRLDFCKSKNPKIETLNFTDLPKGETVTSKLKEMEHGGPDVALECAAGEYAKNWAHKFEIMTGAETDTSEIINEMITSVKNYGRCGITGVYVGFVGHLPNSPFSRETNIP